MARKTRSGRHQLDLAEELKEVLEEYSKELYENKEKALDKAADFLVDELEKASPVNTGEFKKSWLRTYKYKGVRYIGNFKTVDKDIPVSNLIEFSKNGHPFIRKTFDANKEQIIKIIKGELENGNTK